MATGIDALHFKRLWRLYESIHISRLIHLLSASVIPSIATQPSPTKTPFLIEARVTQTLSLIIKSVQPLHIGTALDVGRVLLGGHLSNTKFGAID
jgi:hypothetical protein